MAQSTSNPDNLTFGQGIGIGVAVGFIGALLLILCATRANLFSPKHFISKPKTDTHHPKKPASGPSGSEGVVRNPMSTPNYLGGGVGWIMPIQESNKKLTSHMTPLLVPKELSSVMLDFDIDGFVANYVTGIPSMPNKMLPVEETFFDEDQLVRLAGEPINGGTWSESISNLETRPGAIKCFLAQFFFKRMDPLSDVEENLLPPEISTFYQLVHWVPRNKRFRESRKSDHPWQKHDAHQPQARNTLAVLRETIFLRVVRKYNLLPIPPLFFQPNDPRRERTHAMVPEILDALKLESLRVDQYAPEDIKKTLTLAMEKAANTAIVLFCQPCVWEVEWASSEPGFIIYPKIRLMWDDDEVRMSLPAIIESEYPRPPKPVASEQSQHTVAEQ